MRSFTAAVFLIGLFATITFASPAESTETVLTPSGYFQKSNVHRVPARGSVVHVGNDTIHVLDANKSILRVISNVTSEATIQSRALRSGLITSASWINTLPTPISFFQSTWTVPNFPSTDHGQTIFVLNSMEPSAGAHDAHVRNVLQFGPSAAGGGSFWTVSNWYITGTTAFSTDAIRVPPGARLDSSIVISLILSPTSFVYANSFTNVPGTSFGIIGSPELTTPKLGLEAINPVTLSDYPTGRTEFSGIFVGLNDNSLPSVVWTAVNDDADGLFTTVNLQGGFNGKVTVTY
ncbi:hypothetical protein C8J57DRAFT_1522090 [Mycena rebaudengoi]|nr:hypothetical protein C8J57DRAFT_1522090 [Mycena rebaudengoi]